MDLWATRNEALAFLQATHPTRLTVMDQTFEMLDRCVDAFEAEADANTYARISGLALLKAKHLALGAYSLILDGLGQEAGALMRPMIEYAELLTYFRMFPESVEKASSNNLPKAGERAKAIGGIYKEFREHLNIHASHSSFSSHSLSHLLEPSTFKFKKLQRMVPLVLETNVRDIAVQLLLMLRESVLTLEPVGSRQFLSIAEDADELNERMFHVFELNHA